MSLNKNKIKIKNGFSCCFNGKPGKSDDSKKIWKKILFWYYWKLLPLLLLSLISNWIYHIRWISYFFPTPARGYANGISEFIKQKEKKRKLIFDFSPYFGPGGQKVIEKEEEEEEDVRREIRIKDEKVNNAFLLLATAVTYWISHI